MIRPNGSWRNKDNHFIHAINDRWYQTIAKLEDLICYETACFYHKAGIQSMFLPVTTASVSSPMGLGSDSLPVSVDLFGVKTYLADSMQFMLEYSIRMLHRGAYYIMPTFRGENADERHLCQFFHSEAEIPGGLDDVIHLVETYIKYLSRAILDRYEQELEECAGTVGHIEQLLSLNKIPEISFRDAVELLKDDPRYILHHDEGFRTLTSAGEKALIHHFGGFVWLKYFDAVSVPFYQKDLDDISAMNADLLFGIGEVVGSGERHETGQNVRTALARRNVAEEDFAWYIKMKDMFPLQTSGFGMGIERFLLWLLKHNDIRDCQIIPRFNGEVFIP